MANLIRLSGKEVSGLAARVLASAFMPAGAIGSASEAVEFLELTGQRGLAELDLEKDRLVGARWQAPAIVEEGAGYAVCDGSTSPCPFYFAALADWLAAMATANASATIILRGGILRRYLHTVPYLLGRCGLCALVLERAGDAEHASFAHADRGEWRYCRMPELTAGTVVVPPGLSGPHPARDDVMLVAARPGHIEIGQPASADVAQSAISSASYAQTKLDILATGWPIDLALWSSLMMFADQSLIKTSDRSRLGAG